ncbi:hypothetical protein [Pseudolysinimonas sp.]|uniref:hypothetical protein n=1 Tax=Pseudolysinimonas sp. TaxID=2680009 RepID=UPI00286C93AD|nr:hypothetical protein [Pseudolysinimonas sp.]
MATESDLRDLLRGPDPEGRGEIDLDTVLSRTRRRRRPRVIAAQALGSVALVGVLGTAVVVSIPRVDQAALMTAEDAAAGSEESATAPYADEDALRWMPDACGAPVTDPVGADALALEITIPTTLGPEERIPVSVTLRNAGPDRIVGTTGSAPYVSLARDGIVVWHSYAVQDASAQVVDLDPGESMTFETSFDRVICGTEDDLVMDDPDSALPPAPRGDYELRAVVVVATETGLNVVATGPPLPLEIV